MSKSGEHKILSLLKKHYDKVLILAGFFVFWQLLVDLTGLKEFILPSPLVTFGRIFNPEIAPQYEWWKHFGTTLYEIGLSFLITAVLGVSTGIAMVWSKTFETIVTPIFAVFNSLPKIAFAPLFLLWFGFGVFSNILIAVLMAYFPVVINTVTGLTNVDEDLLDLVGYLKASKAQTFLKIRIPNALPFIFTGLRVSSTLCAVGAIVGEFVASRQGLGFLLKSSQGMLDTPTMFACLILISTLGLGVFGLISLIEYLVLPERRVG